MTLSGARPGLLEVPGLRALGLGCLLQEDRGTLPWGLQKPVPGAGRSLTAQLSQPQHFFQTQALCPQQQAAGRDESRLPPDLTAPDSVWSPGDGGLGSEGAHPALGCLSAGDSGQNIKSLCWRLRDPSVALPYHGRICEGSLWVFGVSQTHHGES